MKKYFLILLCIILTNQLFSQKKIISLDNTTKNSFVIYKSSKSVDIQNIDANIASISSEVKSYQSENFIEIESEGLAKSNDVGKPNIPVFMKLIELPLEATVKFKIISYDEEIIDLNKNGLKQKIYPAQPDLRADQKPGKFCMDKQTYSENKYFNTEITKFEDVGIMRSARLGRLTINPIQYNPVTNSLRVLKNLKIEMEFIGSNYTETAALKKKYSSKAFDDQINRTISNSIDATTQLKSATTPQVDPIEHSGIYVIVADRRFEETLAPFIAHKTSMGFHVIVKYTDVATDSRDSIKEYLQGLYDNPVDYMVPEYVLLVGDVTLIPSYFSCPGGPPDCYLTDLYYFCYNGISNGYSDYIPDVYYGRFVATNPYELEKQIRKTIQYEQNTLPATEYQNNIAMVAGYGKNSNSFDRSIDNLATEMGIWDYPQPYSITSYKQPSEIELSEFFDIINKGAGLFVYDGHGDSGGLAADGYSNWFGIDELENLQSTQRNGIWVTTACNTNALEYGNSFGVIAVQLPQGPVGYIGCTGFPYYYDAEYWLGSSYTLGAFHDLFLDEQSSENYNPNYMLGDMLRNGNSAVTTYENDTSKVRYNWEVFNLLGDPSVKIRLKPETGCKKDVIFEGGYNQYGYVGYNVDNNATYSASNSIIASNEIPDGANVTYSAKKITLLPSFYAASYDDVKTFTANTTGCTGVINSPIIAPVISNSEGRNIASELSTTDNFEEATINIYPNPSDGNFKLVMNSQSNASLNVYNMAGELLFSSVINENITNIDLSAYGKGMYILKITNESGNAVKKVTVK